MRCRFVQGDIKSGGLAACAVVDPDTGDLVSDSDRVTQLWAQHFGRLAADSLGNSRDLDFWEQTLVHFPQSKPLDPCLNDDIQWHELSSVLSTMRKGKATGDDSIPSELWKCALNVADQNGEVPDYPTTPMGKCLLALLNRIWVEGKIPDVWQKAVIVAVPKKGDLTVMGNYRGISLINTGLKILASIVNTRVTDQLEARKAFSKAQAGCRRREEAVAQVVALFETAQRRTLKGRCTVAVFIDLKKAFDTVPHAGMITKLSKYGVSGRALSFIKALYSSSSFRVRTAVGLSSETELLRGVRQGCNLSPLLFNLFVNDLFDAYSPARGHFAPNVSRLSRVGCCRSGVEVPGYPGGRIDGYMFVDDIVGLADSMVALKQLLTRFDHWFTKNALSVGHRKCGVMVFGPEKARHQLKSQLETSPHTRTIQGATIEIVDQYVYLGCKFTETLDLDAMAKARAVTASAALYGMRHFLTTRAIPIDTRAMVYRSVIVASAAYGSELWGMSKHRSRHGEKLQNEGLRLMLGSKASSTATVPLATTRKELRIPPFHAVTAQRRARVFVKFHHVQTQVAGFLSGKLVEEGGQESWRASEVPAGCKRKSWVYRSMQWLKRTVGLGASCLTDHTLMSDTTGRLMAAKVFDQCCETEWKASTSRSVSAKAYQTLDLISSTGWQGGWTAHPELAAGWTQLLRMRTGAFLSAGRLAQMQVLPDQFRLQCPFCGKHTTDSSLHYLVQCTKWSEERDRYLEPVLTSLRNALVADDGDHTGDDDVYKALIGSPAHYQTALEADGQSLSWHVTEPAKDKHCSQRERPMLAISLRVAQFLSETFPKRCRALGVILGAFLQEPRPQPGMADQA